MFFLKFYSSLFSNNSSSFNSARKSEWRDVVDSSCSVQLTISSNFELLELILSTRPEISLAQVRLVKRENSWSISYLFRSSLGNCDDCTTFFYPRSTYNWCSKEFNSGYVNFSSSFTLSSRFDMSTLIFSSTNPILFGSFSLIFWEGVNLTRGKRGSSFNIFISLINFSISCLSSSANF